MKATTVGTLLTDLLATCADAYTTIVGAPAAPSRKFVSFGEPPWYAGDQLAVWHTGYRLVNPFPLSKTSAAQGAVVPAADLMVLVLRDCWPTPKVGTPASSSLATPVEIQAAALTANLDGGTLEAHLSNLAVKGGMFPSLPIRDGDVSMSAMLPVGPSGGHVGYRCTVSVKLAIL